MMETLNQIILLECREEVAAKNGFTSWSDFEETPVHRLGEPRESEKKAFELALDRQAEFYCGISKEGWVYVSPETWYNTNKDREEREFELYQIWREGK